MRTRGTEPARQGPFLQPAAAENAEPRWGHAEGLQVGLHPLPGPRGLLRIFTPYLDQPRHRVMNFVAVEPVPAGQSTRGFSELEDSALDGAPGKRFWSSNGPDPAEPATAPAQGVIETVDGVPHQRVYVQVEPFDNGADVYLRLTFRADRPQEVAIATFARESSVPLDHLITTATMGNFARLRLLRLADRIVTPRELWPDFPGDDSTRHHFAPHSRFGLDDLVRTDTGEVLFAACPDEADPVAVSYADDVRPNWHFVGRKAVQYWRGADPDQEIQGLVNARASYWASESEIPGGPSYENLELVEPFRQGRELVFGIEPIPS